MVDVGKEKLSRLVTELGLEREEVARFLGTKHVEGEIEFSVGDDVKPETYVNILASWRGKTPVEDQENDLRRALVEAKIDDVAEKYLPEGSSFI